MISAFLTRFGWLVVVVSALSISTWSLFWVGIRYGLPVPIAGLVSASFDGAALVSADLALRYARTHGDSGLAARLCVLAFAGASAWLNSQHAALAHDPNPARIMFAFPPVVAVVVFELSNRWIRRGALRAAGRVAAPLPAFGRWAWLLFPLRTLRTVRHIVRGRLDRAEQSAGVITTQLPELDEPAAEPNPRTVRAGKRKNPRKADRTRVIRAWARVNGMRIGDTGPIPGPVLEAWQADQHALSNGHGPNSSNGHHAGSP